MLSDASVLIVDDELGPREALRMILKPIYSICTAMDGIQALDILSSQKNVGVIICDIRMPQISGEELLLKIRTLYPLIPIIMLTGFANLDTAIEVMRRGAFDFLTKPVDHERLINVVRNAFDHRKRIRKEFESNIQEESMAMIGRLTSGIVHNLRNPLTVIMNTNELLKMKYPDEERLDRVILQVNKISEIIDNLMYKTRREQRTKEKRPVNINQLLTEELKFLEADQYFKHGIEKIYTLDQNLPMINANYNDLSQSFINIINNSIDAMFHSEVKRLTVTTLFDNECIIVKFTDTGCGIKKEDIPRLFEPFFTTKCINGEEKEGEPTGTGLGLFSCDQLLKPYNVKFEVKSEVDKGTDITLFFPININN
ncbi:MAG: response regulator [Thermodesulfobacteriota bacterium]|nr:response regulator [Thermodesulfobacteriota bacterium]